MTLIALGVASWLGWAAGRRDQSGRHQRSPGPVRRDGSGWTAEGLATQPGDGPDDPSGRSDQPRGPDDDPEFLAQLTRLAQSKRLEPPADA